MPLQDANPTPSFGGFGLRQMAELLHAEIVGRIHACERLETEIESITDPRVLYGWNMLTQEVLIRLAEASLKLLYMLCFDEEPPHGHSLAALWKKLPSEAQEEVQAKRRHFPNGDRGVSFPDYDMDDFQDVRYSFERRVGGQTMSFEPRRLYLDAFAARDAAEDWLGPITAWPWAGLVDLALAGSPPGRKDSIGRTPRLLPASASGTLNSTSASDS